MDPITDKAATRPVKKRPHFRNQLLLAIALFALGTFAYWHEYRHRPDTEKAVIDSKKILAIRGLTIATIELEREGSLIRFQCEDVKSNPPLCRVGDPSHWRMDSPQKTKADDTNVNNLLTSISNWDPADTIDLARESDEKRKAYLRDYGLDSATKPAYGKVRLTDDRGGMHELYLGGKHPVNGAIFATRFQNGQRDDQRVLLLPAFQWASTDHDANFYRDKRVFSLAQNEVTELEVVSDKNRGVPVTMTRDPVEGWKVASKGDSLPGDPDAIGALTSGVLYLSAKGYAAENKESDAAKALLKGAKRTVTIRMKSTRPKDSTGRETPAEESTLEVYEKKFRDGDRSASQAFAVVLGSDPVYELETTALDSLTKTFEELRLTKLVPAMDRFAIAHVEIAREKNSITLEQEKSAWSAGGKAFPPERLNDLLDALSQKTFGERRRPRKDVPVIPADALTMRMGPKPTDIKFDFAFWREKDATWVVDRRHAQLPAFEVLPKVANALPWEPASVIAPPAPPSKDPEVLMDATSPADKKSAEKSGKK